MTPTSASSAAAGARSYPPLWLFGILVIAGAVAPFVVVAMPFLLRREGISVDTIAGISALAMAPYALMFVWAPLADMLLSRRRWVLLGNLGAAALLLIAILLPRPQYLTLFTVVLVGGNVVYTFAYIALLGLMAELLPDDVRGKAAGWFQAGYAGGIPLLGGGALWLIERLPLNDAAVGIAVMSFAPALPVLFIAEPSRSLAPNREAFRRTFHEVKLLLKKPRTWLGFLFFLSPLGACAAYTLFSAIGTDYHAAPSTVLWVTALPGGVMAMAAGALIAGAINDRFPRRKNCIGFGLLLGLAGAAIACAPIRPATFCAGGLAYEFIAGMVSTSFTALCLELSEGEPAVAGTRMALFTAAGFVPISYMTWLDGKGDQMWGVRGLFRMDACLVLATALVLTGVLWKFRATGEKSPWPLGQEA
jgi:MFS family permease